MPRYRVEVVWVSRDWAEIEVEASSLDEAHDQVLTMLDTLHPSLEIHEDTDPEVEINTFPSSSDTVDPPFPPFSDTVDTTD